MNWPPQQSQYPYPSQPPPSPMQPPSSAPFETGLVERGGIVTEPVYNVGQSHPLIPNSQNYINIQKIVSIHSEDRDIVKYPNSSKFNIILPEDMRNVRSVRLASWTFPANYSTFSVNNANITMTFKLSFPYNPNQNGNSDPLQQKIFEALWLQRDENFIIYIEEGFYTPQQMTTELTNKMNHAVTERIVTYFEQHGYFAELNNFVVGGGYQNFVVVFNAVGMKIWFGNRSDGFTLTNETQIDKSVLTDSQFCLSKQSLPDFSNWGLPGNLGLSRCDTDAVSGSTLLTQLGVLPSGVTRSLEGFITPRFYYGDVAPGDNGYWLTPNSDLSGSEVWWVQCINKINTMGASHYYLCIEPLNCLDETSPFNLSEYTLTNNTTNGRTDTAFAKIPIPCTPISQLFDIGSESYKWFSPPAERIRELNISVRYHNGALVDFGTFEWNMSLEFNMLTAQQKRMTDTQYYPSMRR